VPDSSGGMMAINWFHYLCIARETAETGIVHAAQEGTRRFFGHSLVVIVFSALSVEAFINELAEMAGRDADHFGRTSRWPSDVQVLSDLSAAIGKIEDSHGPVEDKYLRAHEVLSRTALDRGSQPYQDFRDLMSLRDDLVHPRDRDQTDSHGFVWPQSGVVRRLQQLGYTYTRGRRPGDPGGGASWVSELETPEVAEWAYNAAVKIITAIGTMLPHVPPSGISFFFAQRTLDGSVALAGPSIG
jgi:hypothetical protein